MVNYWMASRHMCVRVTTLGCLSQMSVFSNDLLVHIHGAIMSHAYEFIGINW